MEKELSPDIGKSWNFRDNLITRIAWVPIPVFIALIAIFRISNPDIHYYSSVLLTLLNLVFTTLASLVAIVLLVPNVARTGDRRMLILGCGMIFWGFSGLVGTLFGRQDPNNLVTIHNICMWIASFLIMISVVRTFKTIIPDRKRTYIITAGYLISSAAIILIVILTVLDVIPDFFIQGKGGTYLREIVLATAIGMFLYSGAFILGKNPLGVTRFQYWCALALVYIAIGLFGVLMQSSLGSLLNWTGLASQFLGAIYMMVAVIFPLKEAANRNISLEDVLVESEERYKKLIITSPAAILVHSEGKIIFANPAAFKLFGASDKSNLLGRPILSIVAPEFHDIAQRRIRMAETRLTPLVQMRFLRLDGFGFEGEVTGTGITFQGKLAIQIVISDITERKKLLMNLQALNERHDMAERATRSGTWDWNINDNTYSWSPMLYELFGLDMITARACEETWISIIHPDDVETAKDRIRTALEQKTFLNSIYRVIHPNGEICWINAIGKGEYDVNGNPVRMIGICIDITQSKEMEIRLLTQQEELRKLNFELDGLVKERTAELQNAVRELEEYNYSIAHDLRAPLRHLSGYVGLLAKSKEYIKGEKYTKYMDIISDSAIRMGVLIDSILSFSKINRTPIVRKMVNMTSLTNEAIITLNAEKQQPNQHWDIKPLPEVYGDPVLLSIVMSNLLSNAIKFTSKTHEPRIEIGQIANDPDSDIIYVKDNGTGFDMNYYAKLFRLFERLHSNTEYEGTGLGLANVRRIIERHGGKVWAEGETGKGATFYFSLPRKNAVPEIQTKQSSNPVNTGAGSLNNP